MSLRKYPKGTKRIDPLKYYIINTIDLNEPRLIRFGFFPYEEAEKYIRDYIPNTDTVSIIGGYKALKKQLKFYHYEASPNNIRPRKYKYPPECNTRKKREAFRSKIRFWLKGEHPNTWVQGDPKSFVR